MPTEMSFSVSCQRTGLEYGNKGGDEFLNTLVWPAAVYSTFLSCAWLKGHFAIPIKKAIQDLEKSGQLRPSGGDIRLSYLKKRAYGASLFCSHYLITPWEAAICHFDTPTEIELAYLFLYVLFCSLL